MAQGMRRRLSDEVSVQEMLELRARGYKNSEIAEQFEVTPTTILRYIGKNNGRPSKVRRYYPEESKGLSPDDYAACKAHIEAKKAEASKPTLDEEGTLELVNVVLTYKGEATTYHVDREKNVLYMDNGEFNLDKLAVLISELTKLKEAVKA